MRLPAPDPAPATSRHTLDNGLRVVIAHEPCATTVAVAVHYAVGHRNERPGEAGLAHLFEHLATQDRHGSVTAEKLIQAHVLGGSAGATTHQDYTDFYQVVPAAAVETVLHWEADRMRAPRFSAEHLAAQLQGVAGEIAAAVHHRPYGGFPWPGMARALYASFANSHDGYGDIRELADTTIGQCESFFDAHYSPANAVLTVVGNLDANAARAPVEALVERHFGALPARPRPPRPDLVEAPPAGETVTRVEVAGRGPAAAALGYRLPDAGRDLDGYLAHMVLAVALQDWAWAPSPADAAPAPRVSASCGFFGPLDALDPDTLVVAGGPVEPADPGRMTGLVDQRLADLANGRVPDAVLAAAARRASAAIGRQHADLAERCRAMGRFELLFARPGLVLGLPARLARMGPQDIAAAAARLRDAGRAVLLAVPVGQRSVPAVTVPEPGDDAPERADFQTLETQRAPVRPRFAGIADHQADNGHRVTAIAHPGTAVVEARLRLSFADVDPRRSLQLAPMVAEAVGGGHDIVDAQVSSVAGAVDLACCFHPDALPDWLGAVRRLLGDGVAPAPGPGGARRAPRPDSPELADHLCQLRCLGFHDGGSTPPAGGAVAHPRADVVLVGAVDHDHAVDEAIEALKGCPPPDVGPPVAARGTGDILAVAGRGPRASVVLRSAQAAGVASEAAWYLLVAVLSGAGGLASGGRARLGAFAGSGLVAGRDVIAGSTSFFLRGEFPAVESGAALRRLHEAAAGTGADLRPDEVERARDFCVGQWHGAFDSGRVLADTVAQQLAYGQRPAALPAFATRLSRVDADQVAMAWRGLWSGPGFTGALVGALVEGMLAESPWPVVPSG